MMIVSLDWEKACHSSSVARRPALFIVLGAGCGGQRGRAGRYHGMPPPDVSWHVGDQNAGSWLKTLL